MQLHQCGLSTGSIFIRKTSFQVKHREGQGWRPQRLLEIIKARDVGAQLKGVVMERKSSGDMEERKKDGILCLTAYTYKRKG